MYSRNNWKSQENPFTNIFENFFTEKEWENLHKDFDKMREEFKTWGKDFAQGMNGKAPFVNSIETPKGFRIEVAAPGLTKEDFKISIENHHIIIAVEKKEHSLSEEESFRRREFNFHSFKRNFRLPKHANTERITAKYENGLLIIHIEKKEEAKKNYKRDIEVS